MLGQRKRSGPEAALVRQPAPIVPRDGVTSRALVEMIDRFGHRHVEYAGPLSSAAARLSQIVQPGDLVLTLGAGNVYQAGDELLKIL